MAPDPTPAEALEYRCPQCDRWAKWTDGELAASEGRSAFWCQTCGAETPIENMESRLQEGRGDANTAGTETDKTDKGTGEREPHGRSEATVDIVARILVGSDWDDEKSWATEFAAAFAADVRRVGEEIDDALRPVHYREAADSLAQIAEHMPATSSAADLRPGIQYAATLLRHTATDLEDGE
jgi:predicted RNA-binding Zn-ribbon protein involved in translation (DUF1610 family)